MPIYFVRVRRVQEFVTRKTMANLRAAEQWAERNKEWIVQGEFGAEDEGQRISVTDVFEEPEGNE